MPLESEESGEKRRWSSAGRFQCHEADGNNITKPINCLAPKSMDSLMPWVQRQLDDQTLLPAKALWEDTKSTEVLHISTSRAKS